MVFEERGGEGCAGDPGMAKGNRLIDALAVDGEARRLPHANVMPRRFLVPLLGEIEPEHRRIDDFERQAGSALHFRPDFAGHPVDAVDALRQYRSFASIVSSTPG